ncbi:MAG: hypothetical protein AABX33_07720 [Nanoarchaeota archaeon]
MAFHILSLILAGIMSFVDYFTEQNHSKKISRNPKLVSFSAGVAISYILLNLFPEIASFAIIDGKRIFLYSLVGFISLNLIEQYIHKGIGKLKSRIKQHKYVHVFYFFGYNFFVGVMIANFTSKGLAHALLFFIPFLLYIIVEILPQEFEFKSPAFKIFYSMAPLFGAIFGVYNIDFAMSIFGELMALLAGTLLYIVIRESLPSDEAERPFYFIIGVLFYTMIIFMSWNLT